MARHVLPVLAALALLSPWSARATVLVPADLSEIARDAAVIVRGTVTAVHAEWADGRRRVETIVMLHVEQAWKGAPGESLAFKVPGGDMGRYRTVMIGAPTFHEGEEVILFLGARPPAMPYLLGMGQGVYRVARDSRTGVARVISPALVARPDASVTVQRGDPSRGPMTLSEFGGEVRQALEGARGRLRGGAVRSRGTGGER